MKTTNYYFKFLLSCIIFLIVAICFFFYGKKFLINDVQVSAVKEYEKRYTIVIDAGHGGSDAGASVNGVFEKDLNLSVANKVSKFLELFNVDVVMTRREDRLLSDEASNHKKRDDLLNRVKTAKNVENPIFVSLHMNKFPEAKYSGLQVFYSKNSPHSESVAILVQENVKKHLQSSNNRKVKRADSAIYVLDRLFCPSILIECGFLSNEEERNKLVNEEYQNKLAFIIANSIIEYINL